MDPDLERAYSLLSSGLEADEAGMPEEAVKLYSDAVQLCLDAKSKTGNKELQAKLNKVATQALERAELLKGIDNKKPVAKTLPPQPRQRIVPPLGFEFLNLREDPTSPGGGVIGGGAVGGGGGGAKGGYTEEEKKVLAITSLINGREYVPFLSVDLQEKFVYPMPFSDKHGKLALASKQKSKLVCWARPDEFMPQPKLVEEVSCYSVKQTIVSDCSFVASIAISAQYERRFGKKLITSLIYPQNKKGEPVYNSCGKYMVKLIINGVPRKVVIDDYFPLGPNKEPLCSYSNIKNELWISLLEKAYMKVMGGYDFPGSNSNIDLYALTGWIPERVSVKPNDPTFDKNGVFKKLLDRFHKGHVLVTVATGEISDADADRAGLVPTHAYAMLDIQEVDGLQLFKLKNPWSHLRWRGNYSEIDNRNWTPKLMKKLDYDPKNAQNFDNGVFWIDYDSLIQFFDVIYMNWNPELFKHTNVMHQGWDAGLGPTKDLYNISNNPQFSLELGSGSGALWILLSRHITDIEDFRNNKEYITVLVYKNNGKRVYYPFDPPPYIDGVRINSPHYLCQTVIKETTPRKFTLVVSQYEKSSTIYFTLRVYSTLPFTLKKIVDPYKCKQEVTGQWKGTSAGGCGNNKETYRNNPRFQFTADVDSSILVEMRGPKEYQIGFDLVCVVAGNRESPLFFKTKQSGPYRPGFVAFPIEITAGTYDIVPTTYRPNQEGPFFLSIKSSSAAGMSFYLKPPRGDIHLEKLRDLALKRLRVLSILNSSRTSLPDILMDCLEDGDSVVEGTTKDRISHFALKLAACGGNARWDFKEFFVSRESALFKLRLAHQSAESRRCALSELQRHLRELLRCQMSTDLSAWHQTIGKVCEANKEEQIQIPFHLVPDLVSRRAVTLSGGIATASDMNELLTSAFEYFLRQSLISHQDGNHFQQARHLVEEILTYFGAKYNVATGLNTSSNNSLLAVDVQSASADFPPCFAQTHLRLVQHHRLPHSARFAYSLFLKEIGLPQQEALSFWSWHYSQPHSHGSCCSHSWQEDRRKFTYSIRHLYGHEGQRRDYSAHSCSSIQKRSASEQLVCPFKGNSREELLKCLDPTMSGGDKIASAAESENYTGACKLYLSARCGIDEKDISDFAKPSHFYQICKGVTG